MKDTSVYFIEERPIEVRRSTTMSCRQCGALVLMDNHEEHLDWHKSIWKTIEAVGSVIVTDLKKGK